MKQGPSGPFLFLGLRGAPGFTMMEMVVVIVIVAILSIFAFARTDQFATTRGAYDNLLAHISYARKAAVAQRRAVCVYVEADQSRIFYPSGTACPVTPTDGVRGPDGSLPFRVAVPASVTVGAATFQFDGLGSYLLANGTAAAAQLAISVSGEGGNFQITVQPVTGYVR